MSSGRLFRQAVSAHAPLAILGVIDAYAALLAKAAGAKAIYLSGAGVANASFGLPDLAMTTLTELVDAAARITNVSALPLLVDMDSGFGSVLTISRSIKLLEKTGVAAVHIEDQVFEKRCGHRDGKAIIASHLMQDRLKAAVDARNNQEFVIMARTDALAIESTDATLERILAYIEAGADMVFIEAITDLSILSTLSKFVKVPILVNSTEFGKTPLHSQKVWGSHGAQMVLYPLTAFRAMSKTCLDVYQTILATGSQETLLNQLQTRASLYDILHYQDYENRLSGDNHE